MQKISLRYNDNTDEFTILFVEKPGVSKCTLLSAKEADELANMIKNRSEGTVAV